MLKIEKTDVVGWEAAVRGMRNPTETWEESDSFIPCYWKTKCHECEVNQNCAYYFENGYGVPYKKDEFIGSKDFHLMTRLRNAGTDHSKFMRMIVVYVDVTAPLHWWKNFDNYKIETVTNSCSTMHKIVNKKFTLEDFSCEHLLSFTSEGDERKIPFVDVSPHGEGAIMFSPKGILECIIIPILNRCRDRFFESKDKKYWWQIIQLLPSSYNQRSTVMLNYEVLTNIYKSHKDDKLDEWRTFCAWIEGLPYSELITGKKNN